MSKPNDWFFKVRQSNNRNKVMKKYGFQGYYKGYEIKRVFFAANYAEALATLAWTYPGSIKTFFEELPEDDFKNVYSLNNRSTSRKPPSGGSAPFSPQVGA